MLDYSIQGTKMNKKIYYSLVILIAVSASAVFWWWKFQSNTNYSTNNKSTEQEEQKSPAINGVLVNPTLAKQRPFAVVVENHVDARPQSGLSDAEIVYETLAEGGITRFLGIFQARQPKEIGPVRSARPYFNFLANQWQAGYAHVGGSATALEELAQKKYSKLFDLNQFTWGEYFYRSKARPAPHNAYTTPELLKQALASENQDNWNTKQFGEFKIVPTQEIIPSIKEISIKFFEPQYSVRFTFDPTTNSYKRINGSSPAKDKNNDLQLSPMNVLVQFVKDDTIQLENTTGVNLHLDTSGKAILFNNGGITEGTWDFQNGVTSFKTNNNQAMQFTPGQIWVILMPQSIAKNVTWK